MENRYLLDTVSSRTSIFLRLCQRQGKYVIFASDYVMTDEPARGPPPDRKTARPQDRSTARS